MEFDVYPCRRLCFTKPHCICICVHETRRSERNGSEALVVVSKSFNGTKGKVIATYLKWNEKWHYIFHELSNKIQVEVSIIFKDQNFELACVQRILKSPLTVYYIGTAKEYATKISATSNSTTLKNMHLH